MVAMSKARNWYPVWLTSYWASDHFMFSTLGDLEEVKPMTLLQEPMPFLCGQSHTYVKLRLHCCFILSTFSTHTITLEISVAPWLSLQSTFWWVPDLHFLLRFPFFHNFKSKCLPTYWYLCWNASQEGQTVLKVIYRLVPKPDPSLCSLYENWYYSLMS